MTTQSSLVVDVHVACKNSDIPSAKQIEYWVTSAVGGSGRRLAGGTELSVKLVDTDEMRSLNNQYRNKDKVTNVLSFPVGEIAGLPVEAGQALGDIVVCAAVVSDEAARQGKAVGDHWAHLLVHGTLHLLGYDHESDAEAAEMEGLETRILMSNGVADPYAMS